MGFNLFPQLFVAADVGFQATQGIVLLLQFVPALGLYIIISATLYSYFGSLPSDPKR
jgi:hypothetical protein